MRIRTIKPDFWQHRMHEVINETSAILAIGLLNYADDAGRFIVNHRAIECALFPIRRPKHRISACMAELEAVDFLVHYFAEIDGRTVPLAVIKGFRKHQVINRPTKSSLPNPPEGTEDSVSDVGLIPERSEPEGKGREGKGIDSLSGADAQGDKPLEAGDAKAAIRSRLLALLRRYGCSLQMGTKPLLDEWCNAKGKYPIAWIEYLFDVLKERPGLPSEFRKTLKARHGDYEAWSSKQGAA